MSNASIYPTDNAAESTPKATHSIPLRAIMQSLYADSVTTRFNHAMMSSIASISLASTLSPFP